MKLEVGMYVRTLKGIAKIIGRKLEPDDYYFQCWVTDRFLCICDDTEYLCDSDILKASDNIIDLIEVGDYVNGFRVDGIGEYHSIKTDKIEIYTKVNCSALLNCFYEEDIKTIVTKEQFESMSYKVKE